jgi:hypothetical protein
MGYHKKKEFTLASVYDTETTNIIKGVNSRAFPCLFICNDIRGIDISNYETDRDDNIKFFRREAEMISYIDDLVIWGEQIKKIPIICAYNLMFDLQPLMELLSEKYKIEVCAQSSTHVYNMDLLNEDGNLILRFWDTFYLEMRGLAAMGETCGIPKAVGDWDYTKVRNQETELTKKELYYASRDVQVIPSYLKYLMKANDWIKQSDFGVTVLTKTSLVRQMAKHKIANLKVEKNDGKKITQNMMFEKLCYQELPYSFRSYGLRKACFRGGLTFTSARYASCVVENVASLDVTSMHHAFINGRKVPVKFKPASVKVLEEYYNNIINTSLNFVLKNYDRPFYCAFNVLIRFDNLRLKKGSCFDEWGISVIPSAKFRYKDSRYQDATINNYANIYNEELTRLLGYKDKCKGAVFAYGKLYSADTVFLHVTEIELWLLSRVYEWSDHECIFGEATRNYVLPPDYVTLQSNLLFGMKTDVKNIIKNYHYGEPYTLAISKSIPDNIARNLKAGTLKEDFLESYYTSTVKGQFNSIYGTQAQDIYKPEYCVNEDGSIDIDSTTVVDESNWDKHQPNHCKVLYTYGTRIVGGSRLHLSLAMELLYNKLGNKVKVTGGDTDSLKVSCSKDITDDMLIESLEPLHKAVTNAIKITQERVRKEYPQYVSDLKHIGCFEVEDCGGTTRYKKHMEAWNKARVSLDYNNKVHITCAGLSRPEGKYTIVEYIEDMLKKYTPEQIFPLILGFNTFVYNNLCYGIEMHRPKPTDRYTEVVRDYKGKQSLVDAHESIALYPAGRWFGDLGKDVNISSIEYVKKKYGRIIDKDEKLLSAENGIPKLYIDGVEF